MKNYRLRKYIFLTLIILTVAFIFSQSLHGRASSDAQSGRVLSAVLWVLRGLGFSPDPGVLHHFVRKAAHFTEFAALGIFSGGFAYNLGKLQNRRCLVLPLTLPLAVAICDELLQNLTGRSCEVADMALDYAGALFGLGIVVICVFIQNKRARRKEHEN